MTVVEIKKDTILLELTTLELFIIKQALNEACNGINIEDWEFPIRMGVERGEAQTLLSLLSEIASSRSVK
jgi:hypothetical protein